MLNLDEGIVLISLLCYFFFLLLCKLWGKEKRSSELSRWSTLGDSNWSPVFFFLFSRLFLCKNLLILHLVWVAFSKFWLSVIHLLVAVMLPSSWIFMLFFDVYILFFSHKYSSVSGHAHILFLKLFPIGI